MPLAAGQDTNVVIHTLRTSTHSVLREEYISRYSVRAAQLLQGLECDKSPEAAVTQSTGGREISRGHRPALSGRIAHRPGAVRSSFYRGRETDGPFRESRLRLCVQDICILAGLQHRGS